MDLAHSYYLWLMPDAPAFHKFQTIIRDLSGQYQTLLFEPHITLITGLSGPDRTLVKKIDMFTSGLPAFQVTLEGIDYSHGFFTALFLMAQNTPALEQLHQQARQALRPFGQAIYQPHLSLLYGEITPKEKERIIARLNLSPQTIMLNKIKLVEGHADVTRWRTVKVWPLL